MDRFNYPRMIHEALRQVVRLALAEVAAEGLEGDHHFYITFETGHPGVEMPRHLRNLYPEQMVVVLQRQFWDLEVGEEAFSVTLSFDGVRRRITVPYAAIESFVDPGAEFGLRFDLARRRAAETGAGGEGGAADGAGDTSPAEPAAEGEASPQSRSDSGIVRIEDFRKREK